MSRRILTGGALLAVLSAAVLGILWILEIITRPEVGEALWKTLGVITVATAAILVMAALGRSLRRGAAGGPDGKERS
jgi:hypothetical protein